MKNVSMIGNATVDVVVTAYWAGKEREENEDRKCPVFIGA